MSIAAYIRKKGVRNRFYYQVVENRRVDGKPRQRVLLHLGEHPTMHAALEAWPPEVERLREAGRDDRADRLAAKLEKLHELKKGEDDAR